MYPDSNRSIRRVLAVMLVGRLLSLLANQVYLSYFGADSEALNIFSWVLQIPNYLFQSIGTGLGSVVIPMYAALLARGQRDAANRFGSNILVASALGVGALALVCTVLSRPLASLTEFQDRDYAIFALRLLLPVMVLYALTAIYQGIAQSLGDFLTPALVNLPSGILILLYIFLFAHRFGVTGLLVTVVLGLVAQFAILPLPTRRAGFRFCPTGLRDPDLRRAGTQMLPVVLGASAYQLNMLLNGILMARIAPDSVSIFTFVQSLILNSVMVLILAVTSVKFPALTVLRAKDDFMGFRDELSRTMGGMVYLLTPIACGLLCLAQPLAELISGYGKLSPEHIRTEAAFLAMYSLCIVFLGLKEIADRALYALGITKISGRTGVLILLVNAAAGWVLATCTPLGALGIPLGYSLGIAAGAGFLLTALRRRVLYFSAGFSQTAVRSLICSAVMSLCVVAVHRALTGLLTDGSLWHRLLPVVIPTGVGMAVYFALTYAIRTAPIRAFFHREEA